MRKLVNPSLLGVVILVAATAAALWSINRGFEQFNGFAPPNPEASRLREVTVRNSDGQILFQGALDLEPTFQRIARGQRLNFAEDGATYANKDGKLPVQSNDYYTAYVQPTPQLAGPGPQRVVIGRGGEIYYSPDDFKTFTRLR